MASSNGDKQAAARIITHMNNDYQREMALYLRQYALLPATHPDVFSAQLSITEITPTGMAIAATGTGNTYSVPFDPPLQSLSEARQRLVKMAQEARTALGIPSSPKDAVQITEFPPMALHNKVFLFHIALYMVSLVATPWMLPDTTLGNVLDSVWVFGGREGYRSLILRAAWPMLAIHVVEAIWFHFGRMRPYGVPTGSCLWWKWQTDVLVQGVGAFWRVSQEVKRLEAERDGKRD